MVKRKIFIGFLIVVLNLFSLFSISNISPILSKNLFFKSYGIEQGLSHNTVFCIEQDYQGFIWFGTQEGLNRFDGYTFKKYLHNPEDSLSVPGNTIHDILEDSHKNLWIATSEGLCQYNRITDKFTHFDHLSKKKLSDKIITSLLEDKNGNLWVGTFNGGVNIYDLENDSLTIINHSESKQKLSNNTVRVIFEDGVNNIWIGTREGLNKYSFSLKTVKQYAFHEDNIIGGNDIRDIFETQPGELLIATNGGGLVSFNSETEAFFIDYGNSDKIGELSSNTIRTIKSDQNGMIWIGSLNGLFLYDQYNKIFNHYKHNPDDPGSLNAHSIRAVFKDEDGNMWLGLYYGGINFYNTENSQFQNFSEKGTSDKGLSSNIISAIVEDRHGKLWIGTEGGGLNHFDPSTGKFKHYFHHPSKNSISSNFIKSLALDSLGNLWIGTIESGLDYFNTRSSVFTNNRNIADDKNTLSNVYIKSIFIDKDHTVWIGTNGGGLNKYSPKYKKFFSYSFDQGKNSIIGSNVNCIVNYSDSILCIGTNKGLNFFNKRTAKFTLLNRLDNDDLLSEVWCLFKENEKHLWIGTNENGLVLYNIEDNQASKIINDNSPNNNVVYGILPDETGSLWISTNKGISRLNLSDLSFKNYDSHSGLLSSQFNYNSYCKTKKGTLIFGGTKGFSMFSPSEIRSNTTIPKAVITDFRIMNKPINYDDPDSPLPSNIIIADEINLSYKQSVFSIEFASLSFVAPEKNQYEYTLEGFLNQWVYLGNTRTVSFTNLDPGTYRFRLKVSNNDGLWNENAATLKINVQPPWWRTLWAYSAYILIIFTMAFFAIKLFQIRIDEKNKLKYERLEKERIIELNQMKLKFFTNISHEFRTPLSLILGPLEDLQEKMDILNEPARKKLSIIQKNALRLYKLVEQLMTFRKLEAGALQLKISNNEVITFLSQIHESFEELAIKKNIDFSFTHKQHEIYLWFDYEMMKTVFFNVISNAFKHTPDNGRIDINIDFHIDKPFSEITITDNGTGIPSDKLEKIFERFYQVEPEHGEQYEGAGIGLSFAKEIVSLHHGEITAKSDLNKGSVFYIRLLKGTDHLKDHNIIKDDIVFKLNKDEIPYDESGPDDFGKISENPSGKNNEKNPVRLLIVDDNAGLVDYLTESLNDEYQIISASDGMQGLAMSRLQNPDLIIMDVMMPKMNGLEVTEKLKSDFDTCHIPVIMLTARTEVEDQIKGISTGAEVYINKPFSIRMLKTQIKSLLQNRILLRKVFYNNLSMKPSNVFIQSIDDKFIQSVKKIVEENISDPQFNVSSLSDKLGISRMQLNRKINGLFNQTPGDFIRTIRLNRASQLMIDGQLNVSEVIYYVGITSRSYFTKAFTQQFGMSPKKYIKSVRKDNL
jgi:ligand-binding sensor domain-containing protein/signal transduction histidine kinase/AraC-like DNA-binding protein